MTSDHLIHPVSRSFTLAVGAALRSRRLEKKFSQEELAWQAGVAQGSISNYEIGRSDIPLTVLLRICSALEINPADLVPNWQEEEEEARYSPTSNDEFVFPEVTWAAIAEEVGYTVAMSIPVPQVAYHRFPRERLSRA